MAVGASDGRTSLVRVERRPAPAGRCMVAAADIACAGSSATILFEEDALVWTISSEESHNCCHACLATPALDAGGPDPMHRKPLLRCSACKLAHYCSPACQRRDWALHKHECVFFKQGESRVPHEDIRLVARLNWQRALEPSKFNDAVGEMASDMSKFSEERKTNITQRAAFTKYLLDRTGPQNTQIEDLVKDVSLVVTNTISLGKGAGLYPTMSAANHSCDPNAFIVFGPGARARLVASRPIAAGEEICITYTDRFFPRTKRQEALEFQYGFKCRCRLCSGPIEDEHRDMFKCHECKEGRWIECRIKPACSKCGSMSPSKQEMILHDFKSVKSKIDALDRTSADISTMTESRLTTLQGHYRYLSGILDPAHSFIVALRNRILFELTPTERFQEKIDLCYDAIAAIEIILNKKPRIDLEMCQRLMMVFQSYKCIVFDSQSQDGLLKLKEMGAHLLENMSLCYGKDHSEFPLAIESVQDVWRVANSLE